MLSYTGSNFLRQRLVLATISGRPVRIRDIRADEETPGLCDYEASLLRLLDKISDGSTVQIDETGTNLIYVPGQLIGGEELVHDCDKCQRSVTYFLEALVLLAPFAKGPLEITLKGITNNNLDTSIDTFRTVTTPLLKNFGITDGVVLKVNKRGAPPRGGGEVYFRCPIVKNIQPFQILNVGRVKRVRGVAYTTKLSQQFSARMVDKARMLLNDFLPDVWIYTDHFKGDKTGNSPGYGISLVAETIKGNFKSSDVCMDESFAELFKSLTPSAQAEASASGVTPLSANGNILAQLSRQPTAAAPVADGLEEEGEPDQPGLNRKLLTEPELLGQTAAARLLWEIQQGGVVDSSHQYLPVYFMALADEFQASKVRLSKLTPYTVQWIRHLKDFLGVSFEFDEDADKGTVTLKCVGVGFKNIAKKSF